MTWPELRTWAARTAPTRGGHIMGIGGKSGNSMSPGRASEIWPFILNKSCTAVHAIFGRAQFAQIPTTIGAFPILLFVDGGPGLYVVSPTLGNTAHDPGCRAWVIWPENTMTWPKSRILGRQVGPHPTRPEYEHGRLVRIQSESLAHNGLF